MIVNEIAKFERTRSSPAAAPGRSRERGGRGGPCRARRARPLAPLLRFGVSCHCPDAPGRRDYHRPVAIEVTRAAPDRLSTLCSIIGRAFVNEPMILWWLDGQDDFGA